MSGYNTDPAQVAEAIATLERTLRNAIKDIAGGDPGGVAQLKSANDGLKILNDIAVAN